MRAVTALGCVLLGLTSAGSASAQAPDPALAAFNEGRMLSREGRCAEAVPRFVVSLQHERTVGALLNLGDCYERLGQLASAWRSFRDVAAIAVTSDPRRTEAAARAEALAPLVPTLTITVERPSEAPGLRVQRNGAVVPPAAWGSPLPVDPGEHVVVGEAPRRRTVTRTVTLARGEQKDVRIELPLDREGETNEAKPARSRPTAITIALAAATLVGASVGTGFGVVALGKRSDLGETCPRYPQCEGSMRERATELDDSGRRAALVSTLAFTAAGVALIGGIVVWLATGRDGVF